MSYNHLLNLNIYEQTVDLHYKIVTRDSIEQVQELTDEVNASFSYHLFY